MTTATKREGGLLVPDYSGLERRVVAIMASEGVKIPPFKKISKGALIALDVAEQFTALYTFEAHGHRFEIRYVGDGYVFGYVFDPMDQKSYLFRQINTTPAYRYFNYVSRRIILPDHLKEEE